MIPAESVTVIIPGRGGLELVADDYGANWLITPVVLLHGGAQTRQSWGGLPATLASYGFRTLAMDLRGHGESDWAADFDYSPEALVGDVRKVAAYLGRPAIYVGASLGGLVSMLFCAQNPRDALGLILVDVVPRNNPAGVERIRKFMAANPEGFASFEDAVAAVAEYQSHRPRPATPVGLWRNLRRTDEGRLVWHWDPEFLLSGGRAWSEGREDYLTDEARRLTVPTALVVGGDSDVVDAAALGDFRRTVPHAQISTVDRAAHMIAGDRNEAFSAEIVRLCLEVADHVRG